MYRSIVVPLDGSPFAEQAVASALMIAEASGAKVTLVRAWNPASYRYTSELTPPVLNPEAEDHLAAINYLETMASRLRQATTVTIDVAVVPGPPAEAIKECLTKTGAGLVVMTAFAVRRTLLRERRSIGGTRLHAGATASGVVVCVRRVFSELGISLTGKRVVLQGFGKVGGPLAFLLASAGMRVIAVDDVGGAVVNEGGLDPASLSDHVSQAGTVAGFAGGDAIDPDSIWALPCDLLVPAALGDVITEEVAEKLAAPIVVEAANGPTTTAAEPILNRRGIFVVPDILANAGGVTASYFEWVQSREGYPWDDEIVADRLRTRMEDAFTAVWTKGEQLSCSLRRAAYALAVERVAAAFEARGLFP